MYPFFPQSRQLLQKIEKRALYKCIGQTQPSPSSKLTKVGKTWWQGIAKLHYHQCWCLWARGLSSGEYWVAVTFFSIFCSTKDQIPMLAKEIISSLSGEDAELELGNLPRLTVDDILVNVSQMQCHSTCIVFRTMMFETSLWGTLPSITVSISGLARQLAVTVLTGVWTLLSSTCHMVSKSVGQACQTRVLASSARLWHLTMAWGRRILLTTCDSIWRTTLKRQSKSEGIRLVTHVTEPSVLPSEEVGTCDVGG